MPRLLVILLLLVSLNARADRISRYYDYFNTEAFWHRLRLEPAGPPRNLSATDTCILVASNRATGPDSLRFMSEDRGNGSLRYFIVHSGNGYWHLQPCPSLREGILALQKRSSKPWVVYTEGMGKIFTSDVDRGMRLAGQYSVNVVLLDYPSIHSNYGGYKNYRFAWNRSTSIYKDFAPVFDSLHVLHQTLIRAEPISMFFHSMGNNLIRKLVQKHKLDESVQNPWVANVILNSACVPRRGSKRWTDSLKLATRVIVNYNPEDRTLKLAGLAGFRGILGLGPKKHLSERATYVNFNGVAGNGHSNFMGLHGRPDPPAAAFAHYRLLFKGDALPLNDSSRYLPDDKRANVYLLR
jgi:hypothetical protein